MPALRSLMAGLIDYAGLFPPAGLDMKRAVENYAAYRAGADSWMLGRFVLPVSRVGEFEEHFARVSPGGEPWRVSLLIPSAIAEGMDRAAAFNREQEGGAVIDAVELKLAREDEIADAARHIPFTTSAFVEIPVAEDPSKLIEQIRQASLKAKIRTGGVTEDLFPPAEHIARFIEQCADSHVAFKATAGLHHPVRCLRPLTYEAGSRTGWMFGFLNVFVAACFAHHGARGSDLVDLLEEKVPESFRFEDGAVRWRSHRLDARQMARAREDFAIAFGSCSFEEPTAELRQLNFLK
ncbi:MAG: hypothetical protein K2X35_00235 [Bryobacteraceae bacterium]|nr:hypothetical protein [Bryobacteraceae bacterium]